MNAPRPVQRRCVIFSAGQSEQGKDLAAAHSDCVFAIEGTIERAKLLYADLKARLAQHGRAPEELKILSGVTICAAETDAEAAALMRALDDLVPDAVAFDYLAKMTGLIPTALMADSRGIPRSGAA
jgi:alkanesulfonate monooxygenase